jgi:hypothetical protein
MWNQPMNRIDPAYRFARTLSDVFKKIKLNVSLPAGSILHLLCVSN